MPTPYGYYDVPNPLLTSGNPAMTGVRSMEETLALLGTPPGGIRGGWTDTAAISLGQVLDRGLSTDTFWRSAQSNQGLNWEDTGYGNWSPEDLAALPPDEQRRIFDAVVNTPGKAGGALGSITGPLRDAASSVTGAIGDNPWIIPLLGVGLGAAGIGSASGSAFGLGGTTTAATGATAATTAAADGLAPITVGASQIPTGAGLAPIATGASQIGGAMNLPSWVTPAIQGALTVFGGRLASDAAGDAVAAQERGTDRAYDFLEESRDMALERSEPFYQTALSALDDLNSLNAGEYDITQDPSYQFRLDEGMRALENSAFARGVGMSGGTVRRALRYAQDYASTEYDKIYRRLAETAGFATVNPAGSSVINNFGANAADLSLNAGEARGSGYIARGNSWQNALDQLAMIDWSKVA